VREATKANRKWFSLPLLVSPRIPPFWGRLPFSLPLFLPRSSSPEAVSEDRYHHRCLNPPRSVPASIRMSEDEKGVTSSAWFFSISIATVRRFT
jgi:hypothetical protein